MKYKNAWIRAGATIIAALIAVSATMTIWFFEHKYIAYLAYRDIVKPLLLADIALEKKIDRISEKIDRMIKDNKG